MIQVEVRGGFEDVTALLQCTPGPQRCYAFGVELPADVVLRLVSREGPAPYGVAADGTVVVCTWQSAGFSRYAGLGRGEYLLLLSMLGLTQWHALRHNPGLIPEDMVAQAACGCLFERRLLLEDFAVLMDVPHICAGCRSFYGQLCAPEAWRALETTLQQITQFTAAPQTCQHTDKNALAS
jgi:hypothetical protein